MRFPWATGLLCLAVLLVYAASSGGKVYPDSAAVSQNAFGFANPLALVFHLFYHIGVKHVVGNLFPLLVFAFLLETVLPSRDVLLVFFLSGFASAITFSMINPAAVLAGASSGVSGLMTASSLAKPKWGVVLLLFVPLASFFVLFPATDWLAQQSLSGLGQKAVTLNSQADQLAAQGKTAEAAKVRLEAQQVAATFGQQTAARASEEKAQPDFLVHLVGALAGAAYVLLFAQDKVRDGFDELAPLFDKLRWHLGSR